jgi:predicted alpha/beta hydrolase family esterase
MKNAVLLHATDGNPEHYWFPWLKKKLEAKGYEVWAPLLPENHTPNREVYNDFLLGSDWDFEDNIIIGHSSGAVSVLNLLMDERCPKIKMGIMVGAWKGGVPHGFGEGNQQFLNLFPPEGFDFELIKRKAGKLAFLHGDDDPYCPLEQAKYLAGQLDAPLTVVPNGLHLGSNYKELPELWRTLEPELQKQE